MGRDPNQIPIEEREKAINDFRNDLIKIENYLRSQKLNEALNTQLLQLLVALFLLCMQKQFTRMKTAFADVRFIHLGAKDINVDNIKVTDQEIKDYFEKNKKFYKGEKPKKNKFVRIPIQPSKEDSVPC
jgi:hypothetical protein